MRHILMVQEDIAGGVTKALRASIEARPDHHPNEVDGVGAGGKHLR